MKRSLFALILQLLVLSASLSGQERDSIPPVLASGDTLAPQKAEDVKTGAIFPHLMPGPGNRSISGLPCITLTSRNRWYHDTVAPASVSDTSVVYALDGSMLVPFSDSRFLAPDFYIQAPGFTQNYNRYTYVLNNPLKYTDESGESIVAAVNIGAVIGTYIGGIIANKGQYNPFKWNYRSGRTWGYMFAGGLVGAASGYLGGVIAASDIPFANTLSIMASSFTNSFGTHIYTGGQTPVTMSFGVASYDFTNNEWGYLGKKGNTKLQNFGYFMGGLSNLTDSVSAISGGGQTIVGNSASTKDGHEWWGHYSFTKKDGTSILSVGPEEGVEKTDSIIESLKNSIKSAKTNWPTYFAEKGTWSTTLNNVSIKSMTLYNDNVRLWDLLLNSCVGHATRALWNAGIPVLYLFHPHMLALQLSIRDLGIELSPYIYQHF